MTKETIANQAVIIGGSIAGLLTARVLSDFVKEVTIIERDELPSQPVRRKGVPQGAQFHSLHQAGANIVRDLFPDLTFDMETCGLLPCDVGAETHAYMYGGWLPKVNADSNIFWCDRPRFEWAIRSRVSTIPNIQIMSGTSVSGIAFDAGTMQITGVKVRLNRAQQEARGVSSTLIESDIVVDASGRGSRTPQWLEDLGLSKPEVSQLRINMGDATAIFQLPKHINPAWKGLVIGTRPGINNKMGGAHRLPGNQLKVLLAGWFGDHPPTDDAEFIKFSQQLSQPDLYNLLRQATRVSPIRSHKLPSNQWRHYEKMRNVPNGLFVLGDAVCSFNPGYGQGMTIAAQHGAALQSEMERLRKRGQSIAQTNISQRFQRAAAKISKAAWMNATTEDLRYPEAEGERPLPLRFMQTYLSQVMATAHHNRTVTKRFYDVMTLRRSPASIFLPDVLWAMAVHKIGESFG